MSPSVPSFALAFAFLVMPFRTSVPVAAGGLCCVELPVAEESVGLRCRIVGLGKLCFLSTASTVRWKRRNKDCARRRVEGRSMVLESSLTVKLSQNVSKVRI